MIKYTFKNLRVVKGDNGEADKWHATCRHRSVMMTKTYSTTTAFTKYVACLLYW